MGHGARKILERSAGGKQQASFGAQLSPVRKMVLGDEHLPIDMARPRNAGKRARTEDFFRVLEKVQQCPGQMAAIFLPEEGGFDLRIASGVRALGLRRFHPFENRRHLVL